MARILVIDDEPKIVNFIARALTAQGFSVQSAGDGETAIELASSGNYDLLVLDLLMPGVNGIAVLKAARTVQPDQRVLVLSALSDVETKVRALELGASDYLVKPFALAELVARVRAQLRQPQAPSEDRLLRAGGLTLDLHRRTADAGDGAVELSSREFMLLRHLMEHAGQILSRDDLLEAIWGATTEARTNVVDVYVRRLRTKLGHDAIETVRNVGYVVGDAA
jgi:two-component system, OmpR family, response regulator